MEAIDNDSFYNQIWGVSWEKPFSGVNQKDTQSKP